MTLVVSKCVETFCCTILIIIGFHVVSSVARVLCALGQEIFLRPLSTKITEFEAKKK